MKRKKLFNKGFIKFEKEIGKKYIDDMKNKYHFKVEELNTR